MVITIVVRLTLISKLSNFAVEGEGAGDKNDDDVSANGWTGLLCLIGNAWKKKVLV